MEDEDCTRTSSTSWSRCVNGLRRRFGAGFGCIGNTRIVRNWQRGCASNESWPPWSESRVNAGRRFGTADGDICLKQYWHDRCRSDDDPGATLSDAGGLCLSRRGGADRAGSDPDRGQGTLGQEAWTPFADNRRPRSGSPRRDVSEMKSQYSLDTRWRTSTRPGRRGRPDDREGFGAELAGLGRADAAHFEQFRLGLRHPARQFLQRRVGIDHVGRDVPHGGRFLAPPFPERLENRPVVRTLRTRLRVPPSGSWPWPPAGAFGAPGAPAGPAGSSGGGAPPPAQGRQRERGILAAADRDAARLDQRVQQTPDVVGAFFGQKSVGGQAVQAGIEHFFRMRSDERLRTRARGRSARSSAPRNSGPSG